MRTAVVFPGQGSQSVGMLAALAGAWPQVRESFDQASAVLGEDLWQVVEHGPSERLNQTEITQPAMLAAGVAAHRVWRAAGGAEPVVVAGHSLGEYSALVAGGAVDYADCCRLVQRRAQLMQAAVAPGEGGMAAILGLGEEAVTDVCAGVSGERIVEPVNFNAPGQVVIAGHADAVAAAIEAARAAGAKRAVDLPVSVPSHSSLMREAADQLGETLEATEFAPPRTPVLHNVDAEPRQDPAAIRDALRRQLHNPVRWSDTIRRMGEQGATRVVELGPGRVLAGLTRRIDRSLEGAAVEDPDSLERAVAACREEAQ